MTPEQQKKLRVALVTVIRAWLDDDDPLGHSPAAIGVELPPIGDDIVQLMANQAISMLRIKTTTYPPTTDA